MEWSNASVIEFLELLQGEPILWKHRTNSTNHKNRNLIKDAWIRIKTDFSMECTIEELRRKKNTLFTQYRDYLKKIRDSTMSGSREDDIYRPTWFAFDLMNSYLGEVYEPQPIVFIEDPTLDASESQSDVDECSQYLKPSNSSIRKRRREGQDFGVANREMDEYSNYRILNHKNRSMQNDIHKVADECDIYVELLARKLNKLDEDDRLKLMNDIDNLTYKCIIEAKARNRLPSSSTTGSQISNSNDAEDTKYLM
ncbi:uncharacterized protein LOC114355257 [Ostrinia furnacalis]|uniref:uncharacterized protein LOC114355257 n=1 Tax=Ostrinia furnacalis TaxID=93504 RepID=UPI00103F7F99|nr:uncharacterized protein LOC114355257 [Ostrinia furnacalis]